MKLLKPFSILTKTERPIHAIIWGIGLVLINIPSWEVTMGLFHSNDYSLIVPSIYGLVLNAYLVYACAYGLSKRSFSDIGISLKKTALVFVKVTLLESALDATYYALHYWTIDKETVGELIWGQILMNFIFFYLPAIMYGLVKAWQKKENEVEDEPKMMIKDGNQIVHLNPNDLTHIESDGNYCTYHVGGKKHLIRQTLTQAESELPEFFVRCHKSFIINTKLIESHTYNDIIVGGFIIPIGRKYRKDLKHYFR